MPNIENISVRSTTLKPNGILIGGVTSNNGVLSFVANSYFEIPYQKQATMTYVVKFTTPSAYPTNASRFVIHSEWFESIGLSTAGDLYVTDWTVNNRTLVSGMALNSTYWLKAVITPSLRTYYISTDGATFNQVDSYAPTGINVNFDSIFMLGNNSMPQNYAERFWTGTIDLNGCYIEVGGEVVWQGMDYNDIQRVGGDEFDGQWIQRNQAINSSFTLTAGASNTFDISSFLPNDNYDYECFIEYATTTGSASGNYVEAFVYTGSNTSGIYQRTNRVTTRASNTQFNYGICILPVFKSDRKITAYSQTNSTGTATLGLYFRGYRRIGKNGTHSDYMSKINACGTQYDIQGKFLNGEWTPASSQLFSGTLANSGTTSLSLSSVLPNDGYSYLCIITTTAYTGTSSGNSIQIRVGSHTSIPRVCGHVTRTNSNMDCAGNLLCPVSERTLKVQNSGNTTSGSVIITLRGYRRIGTNG